MVPTCVPTLEKSASWHPFHYFTKQIVPSLYVSRIVNPKFAEIVFTGFSYETYKVLPFIKNIFKCTSFFLSSTYIFITHFSWACESLHEPQSFSLNSLFVHSLVCQIIHYFLSQTYISTSPMYALPVILYTFSTLECICERLSHCRLIVAITWTPVM